MLKQFNSNARKLNRVIPAKVNPESLVNLDLTGSLQNIELPTTNKFNSNTKSNPYSTKIVNNKNTITNFYNEVLQFGARQISRNVDVFDNPNNTLTIYNVHTDYGTEGASPNNFEILVFGLHIPGDYKIEDIENNVVITLGDRYIDFDNVTVNDIYVIGKLIDIPVTAEDNTILSTESDLDLII